MAFFFTTLMFALSFGGSVHLLVSCRLFLNTTEFRQAQLPSGRVLVVSDECAVRVENVSCVAAVSEL